MKRNRTISVRVSEAEYAEWEARRATSGRAEMGAWVRAVVLDAVGIGGPGSRAGDLPVVAEVNRVVFEVLMGASNNLNQLTRYSHQSEALAPGVLEAVAAVKEAALAVRGRGPGSAFGAAPVALVPGAGVRRTGGAGEGGLVAGGVDDAGEAAAGGEG